MSKTETNLVVMSLWSGEAVSKTRKLSSFTPKKEIPKLYHSPGVPMGFPGGVPGVDPHRSK